MISTRTILCIVITIFLTTLDALAAVNKQSIQLGRTIQSIEVCGSKALVKVKKNETTSKILTIDLNTLSIQSERIAARYSIISCNEISGELYLTNLVDENYKGLFAYAKVTDKEPVWQYLLDSTYYPVIGNVFNNDKMVIISVSYVSDKAPEDLPNVMVFDKTNGNKIWEFRLPYHTKNPQFTLIGNMLYVSSQNGYIQAYNLDSLSLVWERENEIEGPYVAPVLDKATNTLITGVQHGVSYKEHVETIGLDPANGAMKWQIYEEPSLYFPENNDSGKLIYLQFHNLFTLNWYSLTEGEPIIQFQWKKIRQRGMVAPLGLHVIKDQVLMIVLTNENDLKAYVFNDKGKKINEIIFEDQTYVDVVHSTVSNHTIYGAGNGEFGVLEF